MSTVFIWMSPEPGHLLPSIKIANDLVARGHRVIYQTRSLIRQELKLLGFESCAFFEEPASIVSSLTGASSTATALYHALYEGVHANCDFIEAFRKEICTAVSDVAPDLVLIDGIFDTKLRLGLGHKLKDVTRVIRLYTHLPYFPLDPGELSVVNGQAVFLAPADFEIRSLVYREAAYTEPSLFILPTSPEFPWQLLNPEQRLIYCTFGSQSELYEDIADTIAAVIESALLLPICQFVVNAGRLGRTSRESLPSNVIVCDTAPQDQLLALAAAAIIHGGFGIIKHCVFNRVPMLVLPQQWDQPANAVRVRQHGLGIALQRAAVCPAEIARSIALLTTEEMFAARVAAMETIFTTAMNSALTAELCERALGS